MVAVTIGRGPEAIAAAVARQKNNPAANLGPWLIGLMVNLYFLGVLSSQSIKYFKSFPTDPIYYKGLVTIVLVASLLQFSLVAITNWDFFIAYYGDWSYAVAIPWSIYAEVAVAQLNNFFAQLFFAHRCFLLTGRNWFVLVALLSAMLTALGLFGALSIQLKYDPFNLPAARVYALPALSINFATDVVITSLCVWGLVQSRRGGFNRNTEHIINKLIRGTFQAAAPPALSSAVHVAMWLGVGTRNLAFVFFNLLTPRLYVFSLMYTLNSRLEIRDAFFTGSGMTAAGPVSSTFELKKKRHPTSTLETTTRIVFAPTAGSTTMATPLGVISEHVGGDVETAMHAGPRGWDGDLRINLDKLTEAEMGSDAELSFVKGEPPREP